MSACNALQIDMLFIIVSYRRDYKFCRTELRREIRNACAKPFISKYVLCIGCYRSNFTVHTVTWTVVVIVKVRTLQYCWSVSTEDNIKIKVQACTQYIPHSVTICQCRTSAIEWAWFLYVYWTNVNLKSTRQGLLTFISINTPQRSSLLVSHWIVIQLLDNP